MTSRFIRNAAVVAITTLGVAGTATPTTATGLASSVALAPQVTQTQSTTPITARVGSRGWLGATFQFLEDGPESDMILVGRILPDSPAFASGIRPGDRIVQVNGAPVSGEAFRSIASRLGAGDPISLTIRRGGTTLDIAMRAGERPDESTLLPRLVQIQIDSARASFETRLRLIEEGGAQGGVFFSAPNVQVIEIDGQYQIVTGLPSQTEPGRVAVRQGDEETFRFELRFPEPDEAQPLIAWVHRDSVLNGPIGEKLLLQRRLSELVSQVNNVQRFETSVGAQERSRTLIELDRALSQTERRLIELSGDAGTLVTLIEPLDEEVLITNQQGVTLIQRPLAPYVTGRNRVAGAELREMNRDLAAYFNVANGLLVTDVAEGSPAENAGLLSGDVVVTVGGVSLRSVDQFRQIMARPVPNRVIEVIRRGTTLRLQLQ